MPHRTVLQCPSHLRPTGGHYEEVGGSAAHSCHTLSQKVLWWPSVETDLVRAVPVPGDISK